MARAMRGPPMHGHSPYVWLHTAPSRRQRGLSSVRPNSPPSLSLWVPCVAADLRAPQRTRNHGRGPSWAMWGPPVHKRSTSIGYRGLGVLVLHTVPIVMQGYPNGP